LIYLKKDNCTLFLDDIFLGLNQIENNSIDLTFTSPPYNIGLAYENNKDNLPWVEYYKWCKEWIYLLYSKLKDTGRLCINHYIGLYDSKQKEEQFPIYEFLNISKEIGYKNHRIIIWNDKTLSTLTCWGSWRSASSPFIQMPFEGILLCSKGEWKKEIKGIDTIDKDTFIKGVSGVFEEKPNTSNNYKGAFPESLPYRYIQLLSFENNIILDPFCGSGNTLKACLKSNRKFIGIDNSKIALNLCKNYLQNYNNKIF
jgi:site-specific DNA-methyltransferase (adenine-specific)